MASDLDAFWEAELARFIPDPAAALDEALGTVACPVCQVLAGLPFAYFAVISGRWSEEPQLRELIIAAGGFCNHHTWRLNAIQNHLAIGRVFVDVLGALAERPFELEGECPVCHLVRSGGDLLLRVLIQRLGTETYREAFRQSFGLCYPHWRTMLRLDLPDPVREFMIESQAARTRRLQRDVQGALDKATVELKWTRTKDETHGPRRALLKASGNEGI